MTAEATQPPATDPAAAAVATGPAAAPGTVREKTAIPRNPGRRELGMKATLLFPNKEIVEQYYVPLIYTACRTCYSELTPEDIFGRATTGQIDQAKMQKLISGVIESGHGSTIEHVVFTFGISGVSRTLSHQLVRHRAGYPGGFASICVVAWSTPRTIGRRTGGIGNRAPVARAPAVAWSATRTRARHAGRRRPPQ